MKIGDSLKTLKLPYKVIYCDNPEIDKELDTLEQNYCGIILSGSARYSLVKEHYFINKNFILSNLPVLGICYGNQLLAFLHGSKMTTTNGDIGEHGMVSVKFLKDDPLFKGYDISKRQVVTMLHYFMIAKEPENSTLIASTDLCKVAGFKMNDRPVYGLQFHPERDKNFFIFKNFYDICIDELNKKN